MAKIPESYLPPPELRPKRLYTLDEFKNIPQKFNSTEVLLDQTAAKFGDKVAIYFDEQRITYKQLQASVNRVANGLKKLGVEEGDRVLMRMPNIPPIIVCNFAIIKIGAVSLPTSVLFSRAEVAHVANLSEAKVIIVAATMLGEVEAAKADLKFAKTIVVVGGDENEVRAKGYVPYADLMKNPDQCEAVKRDRMDVSVLLFTSGTTGLPKGTAHFMEESLIVADGFGKYCWEVSDKDVIGGPAPLAMAAGYSTVGVIPFRFGAAVSLIGKFDPVTMFRNIQNHKITIMTALPTAYRKMLIDINPKDYDYSSLRFCTGGGEALTAKTYLDWKEKFGLEIYEGLGTTEMMFVFISAAVTKKVKPGPIGTACPGYDVRVVNENFEQVKPGEVGKMIVRGPTGTIYWKDNDKQKSAVRDGWCLAGDVVTMDEDGYVQFLSREDDLIKSSGYRIGPEEIEEALVMHPSVADAGVVGVPDPVIGQKTKAFVTLKPGVTASEALKKELIEHCKGKIAVYKLPREIEFIERDAADRGWKAPSPHPAPAGNREAEEVRQGTAAPAGAIAAREPGGVTPPGFFLNGTPLFPEEHPEPPHGRDVVDDAFQDGKDRNPQHQPHPPPQPAEEEQGHRRGGRVQPHPSAHQPRRKVVRRNDVQRGHRGDQDQEGPPRIEGDEADDNAGKQRERQAEIRDDAERPAQDPQYHRVRKAHDHVDQDGRRGEEEGDQCVPEEELPHHPLDVEEDLPTVARCSSGKSSRVRRVSGSRSARMK